MTASSNERVRAVTLTAVMVFSVFAGTAVVGTASAATGNVGISLNNAGDTATVTVEDADLNTDSGTVQAVTVNIDSDSETPSTTVQTSSDTPDSGTQTYTVSPGGLVADRNNDNTIDKADFTLSGASDESISSVTLNGNGNYDVTISDAGSPDDGNKEYITYTKLQGGQTSSDTGDNSQTTVATSSPVGDRDGDGAITKADIDLVTSASDESISSISINTDGTVDVTIADSGGTSDSSESTTVEQFTYLPTETVTLTETGPDTGTFTGSISVDQTDSNGVLYAQDGDHLTTTYWDSGTRRTDSTTLSLSDTTSPSISNVALSESSGDMVISFDSDEQLGTSTGDIGVSVSGANGGSYFFDRSDFSESGSGPYTYTLTTTQAYDDGDGTYGVSVDDAKDSAGNNGGNNGDGSGLTDTYDYSSGGGDTTSPSISDVYLGERNGDLYLSFDSNEQLGSNSGDIAVSVDGPNTGTDWQTFARSDFSETQNADGSYTYTLSTTQAYDDGTGIYTATVDDAKDSAGNNGGENGEGSGLSASHDTGDTTAPTISSVSFTESSNSFSISFDADEQLGRDSGDVSVTVTGPNGKTYSFGPSDFSWSFAGGTYTYTLVTSQSFDDGQGSYTVTVDDAKDAAGNNGGNDGEGSGLSASHDFSDTTAPSISSVSLSKDSGRLKISFVSDEQLGSGATDLKVSVDAPNAGSDWKTFYRHDFTEKPTQNGNYKYTLDQNGFDSGTGTYTLTVDDAKDSVGNNGGVNGEGSSLTDTYDFNPGSGTPAITSTDIEYISGPAKYQNDADVEKNIHVRTQLGSNQFEFSLFVAGDQRSATDQKRDLTLSPVGFTDRTKIRVRFTVTNYSPDITMGPANVSSIQVTDKSGNKKEVVVELHPTTVQRNFNAPFAPSQWDPSKAGYKKSWEQAQVGVDAMASLQMQSIPNKGGISKLSGARLNTNAQAFTVPTVSNGQLVFNVAAPHCKVGAKTDPNDPAAADKCNSQYVNSDGFYEAVVPKAFWEDQWGSDLDPNNVSLVYDVGGSSETLTNVEIRKLNDGDLYIEAKGFHYSSGDLKTLEDTTKPTADAGSDASVSVGSSVSFDASSSSDSETSVTTYKWDFDGDGTYDATGAKPSHSYSSPGTYTVTLKVEDGGSNTATDTVTVTVSDNTAPTASAGSDKTISVGTSLTFDGSGSSDNVGITSYEWDFDGDGTTDATGTTPSYTFSTTGTYDVTLTVADGAGQTDTATRTITVTDSDVPTASVGADTTVTAGASVSFDGSGSADNVGISSYEWDFDGDGTVDATGATAAHTYTDPGTYTASLTVTDGAGNTDTATRTITVEAADDGGSNGPPIEVIDTGSQTNVVVRSHSGGVSVDLARTGDGTGNLTADRIAFDTTEPSTFTLNVSTPRTAAEAGVPEPAATDVGRLVGYVQVDHSVGDEKLSNVQLNVTVSWDTLVDGVKGGDVVLYRYHDGEWQPLDTRIDHYSSRGVHLTAESPGLSVFAVGTEREAAFTVDEATVDATSVTAGEDVTVAVPVENTGSAVGETTLELTANDRTVTVETVRLVAGQSTTVQLPATFDDPGEYELRVNGDLVGTVTVETADATATPGSTATPESTPAATATPEPDATATPFSTETPTPDGTPTPDDGGPTAGSGPGFGLVVALLALLVAALAARRRR